MIDHLDWLVRLCDMILMFNVGRSDESKIGSEKSYKILTGFCPFRIWLYVFIEIFYSYFYFFEKKIILLVRFPPIQIKSLLIHRGMPIPFQFFGHFYRWLNFRKFFAVAQISKSCKILSWASSQSFCGFGTFSFWIWPKWKNSEIKLPLKVSMKEAIDAILAPKRKVALNSTATLVLYMSFDRFLLAVESRDRSQADKSIIRVFPFQSWMMGSRTSFPVSQQLRPELSAKWMISILSDLPLTRKTEKTVYL